MKKGLTLVETVVSAALISILVIALSALNLTNIKTNNINIEKDEAFNIARGLCEMFKSEDEAVPQRCVVIYIDKIDDIFGSISNTLLTQPNCENKDHEQILNNNFGKKRYALLFETSITNQMNVLKVTVISMNELKNSLDLLVIKPLESML